MNLKIGLFIGLLLLLQLSLCQATTPGTSSGTSGRCSTWGSGNYQMLNGQTHYVNTNNKVALTYHSNEENPEFYIYCQRDFGSLAKIHAKIDNSEIIINTSAIYVNNQKVKVPFTNGNIHIRNSGMYTQISSLRGVLTMTFHLQHGINIHLQKDYETSGICGNSTEFSAEEWPQFARKCMIHEGEEDGSVQFLPNLSGKGKEYCDNIFKTYFHDMTDLKSVCEHDYELCDKEDARSCTCSTLTQAAKIIGNDGCSEETRLWREDTNVVCDRQNCSEPTHTFSECAPISQPTCSNPSPVHEKGVIAGCACPNGLVLDDIGKSKRCVKIDECPCFYEKIYQPNEKRKGSCNSECSCSGGKWICSEENCPGTCKITHGIDVETFDGMAYSLSGNCQYIIFQIPGLIILADIETPNAQSTCSLSGITININVGNEEHTFVISKDCTFRDMDLAYHMSDYLYVKQHVQAVYAKILNTVELSVQCKPTMGASISIPFENPEGNSQSSVAKAAVQGDQSDSTYNFLSKGLCGSYNKVSEDDLTSSNDIIESLPAVFADSWSQYLCPPAEQTTCINLEKEMFAEEHCSELKNLHGVFSKGHSYVDYGPYYKRCVSSTCKSEDVWAGLCSALENYVRACAEKGVLLHNWRKQNCKKECMNNQVLHFTTLSCFPSCASTSHICDNQGLVMEMCTCEEGQYLNSENICVPKEDCDCQHRYGVIPAHKEIEIDKTPCKCKAGRIECNLETSEDICSGGAKLATCTYPSTRGKADRNCKTMHLPPMHQDTICKRGCYCPDGMVRDSRGHCIPPEDCPCLYGGAEYNSGSTIEISCRKCACKNGKWDCTEENCESVCSIHGSGHISSFDGMWYTFRGLCQYTFVEGEKEDTFRISMQSEPCCEGGLTCSRKVILQTPDVTITLQDGKARTEIPQDCSLINTQKNTENTFSITNLGLFLVISLDVGIVVTWDKKTDITVKCSSKMAGKVRGLCGNNNYDKTDDFTARSDSRVTSALDLGDSYKDDPSCPDTEVQQSPCDANPNCKPWALRKCQIMKEELFKECHSKVDPTFFYEKCIEEACVCDMEGKYLGFCSSVAMYARSCLERGVCVNWRNPDLCPVFCDYYNIYGETTWHYEPCGSAQVQTCGNQELYSSYSALLEGCYPRCPIDAPFLDQNSMKCVKVSECSCSHNGRIMAANSMIVDECGRTCNCSKGHVIFQGEMEIKPKTEEQLSKLGQEHKEKTSTPKSSEDDIDTSSTSQSPEDDIATSSTSKSPEDDIDTSSTSQSPEDDIDTSSTSKSPEEDIDSSTPKSSPVDKDKSTPKSSAGLPPSSEAVSTWSTPAFTFGTPLPGPVLPAQPTIDLSHYITPIPSATKPPKKGCCGPSGEHLGHGDSWGTGCIMCTCNGNTGQMECGSYPCEEVVCGANEVKVFGDPSNQSGKSCCGYCAPLTCKHNGTYYQINESFRDPNDQCLVYTCSEAGLTAEAKRCPPQACTPERRTYDADGCCYKCDTNCRPTPAILFIEKPFRSFARTQIYKTCKAKVSISTCTGQCERSTRYDDQSTEVRVDCKCCQEEKHKERSIQLDCSDGTKEKHTFKDIASCACKSCN